ncbi:HAD family hydrolase [Paenibacillus harenae]|uniref:HAD family hydrolase n=1 Tax=Paenibacillus harenae TaxID=306543 RepID=UPI0027946D1A|nr:HAD family hydrolase [Paenibacillus harenae]MDQ0062218.1 putative hydrolase of the HAD superfamily [Paenibacillus harenae]
MNLDISLTHTGVFFDVDDTLYDHLMPFRKAVDAVVGVNETFPYEKAYHRMRYYSDILSLEMGGAGKMEEGQATEIMRRRRFQLTLAEFGIEVNEQQSAAIQAAYIGCQFDITMFDGARALLERLNRAGYIVGLITNGAEAHQMSKIKAMELDALIPPERQFVSGKVGHDKPDRRIFDYVNEQTGTTPANSIYIGDSWRNDVIGAIEAGWSVIWFNHRSVMPESEHRPHHIASSYEELSQLLPGNEVSSV